MESTLVQALVIISLVLTISSAISIYLFLLILRSTLQHLKETEQLGGQPIWLLKEQAEERMRLFNEQQSKINEQMEALTPDERRALGLSDEN